MEKGEELLRVAHLTKEFVRKGKGFSKKERLIAVNDVSFELGRNETLGLVGESGCGKTTLGRAILRLTEPTSGEIIYDGRGINDLTSEEMRALRMKMQIIFQDPYASLNPRMTVGEIIQEPLEVFGIGGREERAAKLQDMIGQIGIREDMLNRYPHEFSGGQRQRIMIARAMITDPDFVVCDEPVSALDVSIRSQVLNLMRDFQKARGLSYLFISHDLSVVKHFCNRIAVMYLGRVVEIGEGCEIFSNPRHPYTQALISAIPVPDVRRSRKRILLEGEVPSPLNIPSGCSFHKRCRFAREICRRERPELERVDKSHFAACHLRDELELGVHDGT